MSIPLRSVALAVGALFLLAMETQGEDLASRLAAPSRAEADRARDAGRKPVEVLAFLGIGPAMTVVDLIAAGGYYTEVLSLAVGRDGKVYAQNNEFILKMRDGINDKTMTSRLADDRLPNVERLDREMAEIGLAEGSVDAAITALNFHDIYNGRGPEAAASFLSTVRGFLKPGGVLGIVDHVGVAGADNEELHRIELQLALDAAKAAGFEVETSDLLRNETDDHTKNVFAPGLRGQTDRFLLKLRKPVS